jgi:hypothetical protein
VAKPGAVLRWPALTAPAMLLALAACTTPPALRCKPGEQRAVQDTLYFGTHSPRGAVTADEWTKFLESTVTPRFPQGLTVSQASGQWRGADGIIVRESTYVLSLIHPQGAQSETSVAEIVTSYKTAFEQESVLRSRTETCASF